MGHRSARGSVTLHRFFLGAGAFDGDTIHFSRDASHQLSRVLRCVAGDRVVALDGSGMEYEVVLGTVGVDTTGTIETSRWNVAEPHTRLSLNLGLLKGSKFELVLQKCTEIGVCRFVPVTTSRAIPSEPGASRQARFETIAREAAEQCRRGVIPLIEAAIPWKQAVERACACGPAVVLWEGTDATPVERLDLPSGKSAIAMFVGPEGGLTTEEVEYARQSGAFVATVGPRILRAETAAIVGSALLLARAGDL